MIMNVRIVYLLSKIAYDDDGDDDGDDDDDDDASLYCSFLLLLTKSLSFKK